jgi:hypothetical protein
MRRSKFIITILIAGIFVILIPIVLLQMNSQEGTDTSNSVANNEMDTSDWLTYRDEESRFTLKYPAHWKDGSGPTSYGDNKGEYISFYEQIEEKNPSLPNIREFINIEIFDALPNETNEDAYKRISGLDISELRIGEKRVDDITAVYYCDIPGFVAHCALFFVNNAKLFYIKGNNEATLDSIIETIKITSF